MSFLGCPGTNISCSTSSSSTSASLLSSSTSLLSPSSFAVGYLERKSRKRWKMNKASSSLILTQVEKYSSCLNFLHFFLLLKFPINISFLGWIRQSCWEKKSLFKECQTYWNDLFWYFKAKLLFHHYKKYSNETSISYILLK